MKLIGGRSLDGCIQIFRNSAEYVQLYKVIHLPRQVLDAFGRQERGLRRIARPLHRSGRRVTIGHGVFERLRRRFEDDFELPSVTIGFEVVNLGDMGHSRYGESLIRRDPFEIGPMLLGDADRPPRFRTQEPGQ